MPKKVRATIREQIATYDSDNNIFLGTFDEYKAYCEAYNMRPMKHMNTFAAGIADKCKAFIDKKFADGNLKKTLDTICDTINNMADTMLIEDSLEYDIENSRPLFEVYKEMFNNLVDTIEQFPQEYKIVADENAAPGVGAAPEEGAVGPVAGFPDINIPDADALYKKAGLHRMDVTSELVNAVIVSNLKMMDYFNKHQNPEEKQRNAEAMEKLDAFNKELNDFRDTGKPTENDIRTMSDKYNKICAEIRAVYNVKVDINIENVKVDEQKVEEKKLDPNAVAFMTEIQAQNEANDKKVVENIKAQKAPEPVKAVAPPKKPEREYVDITDYRKLIPVSQKSADAATAYDPEDILLKLDVMGENLELAEAGGSKEYKKLKKDVKTIRKTIGDMVKKNPSLTTKQLTQIKAALATLEGDAAEYIKNNKKDIKFYKNDEGGVSDEVAETPEGNRLAGAKAVFGMIPDLRTGIDAAISEAESKDKPSLKNPEKKAELVPQVPHN